MFTAAGSSTGAQLIQERFEDQFTDAVYINNQLMSHFPEFEDHEGGRYFGWIVRRAGNTSVEVFVEGQAQPAAGNQAWIQSQQSPTYFRAMIQITGHARDAMKSAHIDGLTEEMVQAEEDIRDLMNTSFMGGTYGLELSVDDTASYGGIARGSASYWESVVTDKSSAALNYTDIRDTYEQIRDNDHGGNPGIILCPWNQNTNIFDLNGNPAVKVTDPADLARGFTGQTFDGIPIYALGDMSDGTILFLDMRTGKWRPIWFRRFEVMEMAPSGDSRVFQVSCGAVLANKNPVKDGKIENAAA